MSNNLRVIKRRKTFVILDYDNNRKQIGEAHKNITNAKLAYRKLIADVATKKVVITDRYKFKDEFKKYADEKLASTEDGSNAICKASVRCFESYYRNYIHDAFPNYTEEKNNNGVVIRKKSCVYLDEITGKVLHTFVRNCYQTEDDKVIGGAKAPKKKATWKTAQIMISCIKTFFRDCDAEDKTIKSSVFNWRISKQTDLKPDDHDLRYRKKTTPIMPDEAGMLIKSLYASRNKDFSSAYKLAIVSTLTFTGLRFSELTGIKKEYINLKNKSIFIAGVYDHKEGRYRNRTKREESRRPIEIQNDFMPFLAWWLNKIKDNENPYLFPPTRILTSNPISEHNFRTLLWTTFADHGLAKLKWKTTNKNNLNGKRNPGNRGITKSFKVISSPFKGCPTRAFRNSFGTHLVNAVKSDPALDENYVRSALGHGDYRTTQLIYGTHIMTVSKEDRIARRAAVSKALKLNGLKLIK